MSRLPVSPWRYRAFALDVDGTLLSSAHRLTAETIAAVGRAGARGAHVLLVSSRPPIALWPILAELGLVSPAVFVGSQGAITGSYSASGDLEVVAERPMPAALALQAVAVADAAGLAVNWFARERWLVSHLDDQVRREAAIVACQPTVADLAREERGPDKLLLIAPASAPDLLARVTADLPAGLVAQTSNPTYLEITAQGVDKASALAAYCRAHGIAREEVVAAGDGMNDLAMLTWAGLAVAPANARPEVRAAADRVTASNDENGVALILDELA